MFHYGRKERASWGLTLTQPSTWSRARGSFSFVKAGRGNRPIHQARQSIFSDNPGSRLNKGSLQLLKQGANA
jgi:hypothetical protein